MSEGSEIPFVSGDSDIQKIGGGAESTVSKIAFNNKEGIPPEYSHVLKEPRSKNYIDALAEKFPPQTEEEIQAVNELSQYFNSKEHFIDSQKDYEAMKRIFGTSLADTMYVISEPRQGNKFGFYIFQKKVDGTTLKEFSKNWTENDRDDFSRKIRKKCQRWSGELERRWLNWVLQWIYGTKILWWKKEINLF